MEFPTDSVPNESRLVSMIDPYLYLRQADRAVELGNRDQAVTLIARVYLAFDLLVAGSDEINDQGMIQRERSN